MRDVQHRPALVLRTGDAIPEVRDQHGEFAGWIARATSEAWSGPWAEHDARTDVPLPDPRGYAAVVVTGSSASVTERAPWMLRTEEWIRSAHAQHANLFGICFGHQIIGQALGGLVAKNPNGREIGKVTVEKLADDAMFFTLPERFAVHATHVDSVVTLPPGAKLLARTSLEPHAAYAIGETVRCVQYHPEMDADVMRKYIAARWNGILADGLDAEAIRAGIGEAPDNSVALTNFVKNLVTSGV